MKRSSGRCWVMCRAHVDLLTAMLDYTLSHSSPSGHHSHFHSLPYHSHTLLWVYLLEIGTCKVLLTRSCLVTCMYDSCNTFTWPRNRPVWCCCDQLTLRVTRLCDASKRDFTSECNTPEWLQIRSLTSEYYAGMIPPRPAHTILNPCEYNLNKFALETT